MPKTGLLPTGVMNNVIGPPLDGACKSVYKPKLANKHVHYEIGDSYALSLLYGIVDIQDER